MLLGNYQQVSANPGRAIGRPDNPVYWRHFGSINNFYYGDSHVVGETDKSARDNGYAGEYAWHLSPKAGGLSTYNEVNGTGTFTISSLALGRAVAAALAGVGTIDTASLSLITSMASTIAGSGTLSASMVGVVNMACGLAGSGDLTAAMGALAFCVTAMTGSGTLASDLRGKLNMEADIYVNQSEATVQQIVDAVWNALAAEYDLSGTMGEKLNGAGSAGDPWTTDLSSYNTAQTAGKILKERLSKSQFLGLK